MGAHGLAAAGVTLRFFAAAGVRSPSLSLSSTNTSPSSAPSEVSCIRVNTLTSDNKLWVTMRFYAAAGVRSPSLSLSITNTSPSSAPSKASYSKARE